MRKPVSPACRRTLCRLPALSLVLLSSAALGQTVTIDSSTRFQTIDGFGTCMSEGEPSNSWWQQLYFDDMQFSVMRMDLTPQFMPDGGVTTDSFCSPWYANPAGALHLPQADGGCGPDNNCTRTYSSAADYTDVFGGCSDRIAVMGPDITTNVKAFDFGAVADIGHIAQMGAAQASQLSDFKLYASLWSPAPWVKLSSGNTYPSGSALPSPAGGTPWPFIWGGNFAGGVLDVSGTTLSQFNDGVADTSALTQFTRLLAAYLKGFQDTYGVKFYAISLQNELDFEEFYNSMLYPRTDSYIAALKAVRAELDAQPDLAAIKIFGPEDVIGGDPYGMYTYGSPGTASERDKNLHFLNDIAADPDATKAIGGFNIHGYASDGVSAAGANSQVWDWWVNGWKKSPGGGLPAKVAGFKATGKSSWMTETSGESTAWLANDASGFPSQGAFGIAVGMHETLVTGEESAFLYWQLTDGKDNGDAQSLTGSAALTTAPKYNALKHFARYIRPGSVRVSAAVTGTGASTLLASSYLDATASALTVVLINESASAVTASLSLASAPAGIASFDTFTSSDGSYWMASSTAVSGAAAQVSVPGYGVVSLHGVAAAGSGSGTTGGAGTGTTGSGSGGVTGGASGAGSSGGMGAGTGGSASGSSSGSASGGGTHSASGQGCGFSGTADCALFLVAGIWATRRRRVRSVLTRKTPEHARLWGHQRRRSLR